MKMAGFLRSALEKVRVPGELMRGIELSLDNDWSSEGEAHRIPNGHPCGMADLRRHAELVRKIDGQVFAAVWMRDMAVRRSRRPIDEVLDELAGDVLPQIRAAHSVRAAA